MIKLHAKIESGRIVEYAMKTVGEDHGLNSDGEALWRPYLSLPKPVFDSRLQSAERITVIDAHEVRRDWVVSDRPIADIRAQYVERINDRAEEARMQWVTPGSGMAMTYQRKAEEAAAAAVDPSPTKAGYPVLSASIGIEVVDTGDEADDLKTAAQLVLARENAFAQAAMAIEAVRLGALSDVGMAADGAAIVAIWEGLTWPSP